MPNLISAPTDKILDLLSTFSSLRSNNRILVNQIRGTMDELHELRGRLRSQNHYSLQGNGASSEVHLGERFGLTRREVQQPHSSPPHPEGSVEVGSPFPG